MLRFKTNLKDSYGIVLWATSRKAESGLFCKVFADCIPSNMSSSWASPLPEDVTSGLVSAHPDKETGGHSFLLYTCYRPPFGSRFSDHLGCFPGLTEFLKWFCCVKITVTTSQCFRFIAGVPFLDVVSVFFMPFYLFFFSLRFLFENKGSA